MIFINIADVYLIYSILEEQESGYLFKQFIFEIYINVDSKQHALNFDHESFGNILATDR